jgi:hypothetical protein
MVQGALAINAEAVDSLVGDYNFDGMVDAADFVVWRKSDGEQPEYEAWRENFGSSASGAGNVQAAVPEPTSLLSAFAALASLILCGTTRKRERDRQSVVRI